ncbi:MAG: peroxiredoxin [Pyrinomonadaceae bacterium]
MTRTVITKVGDPAPDFALTDGDGNEWRLSAYRGRVVVLLFYPGDETPICTRQMCSLRDHWQDYLATGAEVAGISTDTVDSHKKFSQHHNLPLRLLADVGGEVSKLYGAKSIFPGRTARSVFVIDPAGVIRYRDVRPVGVIRPKDDDIISAIREAR